jgi:hypothetical protein
VNKIGHQNAIRWYSFDPFAHRAVPDCTVRALRSEAGDHDVSIRPYDKGRFEKQVGIEIGKLASKATA